MKMLNAWTYELDEPEIAVSEILSQLDLENNALTNSVAFVTCSYDFVESGMVQAVCDAIPFDVVGCTTLTNATNEESGTMLMCLTVLTADDCTFTTYLTDSLEHEYREPIQDAADKAKAALGETAKMAIAFLPIALTSTLTGGELMLATLDSALDGVPIFGTIGCDFDTAAYSNTFIIHNGNCEKNSIGFILIAGNVNPRFIVASTSEQNLRKQQAMITSSEGNLMKQVNNMSAKDYFESLGLMSGRGIEGMSSIPFVVDYGDGTQPVARAIYGLNEDGSAVCGGKMPEGSTLYIGRMEVDDILLTADASVKELLDTEEINGLIMFPCLGRNMVLATDPFAEIGVVKEQIGDKVPWHLAYSGGECCPVYDKDGNPVSRFHNFTFIACAI